MACGRPLSLLGASFAVLCMVVVMYVTVTSTSDEYSLQQAEHDSLEKYVHAPGDCSLGTFISLMPCKKNVKSKACCGALKAVFKHKCACK